MTVILPSVFALARFMSAGLRFRFHVVVAPTAAEFRPTAAGDLNKSAGEGTPGGCAGTNDSHGDFPRSTVATSDEGI